jgi:hypothetical protein
MRRIAPQKRTPGQSNLGERNIRGTGGMRFWQLTCFAAVFAASPLCVAVVAKMPAEQPDLAAEEGLTEGPSSFFALSAMPATFSQRFSVLLRKGESAVNNAREKLAKVEHEDFSLRDQLDDATSPKDLGRDPYDAELPDQKPAEVVLDSLRDIPVGTPVEEIKRAADVFGLDFGFMEAMAKIESDFDPKRRTGSYIGLFQLSKSEFRQYGSGDITNPRDNAVAAAYKLVTEATLFEQYTHREATAADLYLIHQQGARGAAEHVNHPERMAWKSMCATDEGRHKGEGWCKRAIWGNTLPAVKQASRSVNKLTSADFMNMWRQRVDQLKSRYAATAMAANENR